MRRTIAWSVIPFTLTVADNPFSLARHETAYPVFRANLFNSSICTYRGGGYLSD
jgi:hypothetical protein